MSFLLVVQTLGFWLAWGEAGGMPRTCCCLGYAGLRGDFCDVCFISSVILAPILLEVMRVLMNVLAFDWKQEFSGFPTQSLPNCFFEWMNTAIWKVCFRMCCILFLLIMEVVPLKTVTC